jgi:NitT/TauT family transport system permease protein/taurine transport system permease protein
MRRLLGLALLILWEVLPRAGLIPSLFLPPLTETLRALVAGGGEYLRHLLLSLYAIGLSMLAACGLRPAACGIGIGAGLLIGSIAPVRRVVQPLATGFRWA